MFAFVRLRFALSFTLTASKLFYFAEQKEKKNSPNVIIVKFSIIDFFCSSQKSHERREKNVYFQ